MRVSSKRARAALLAAALSLLAIGSPAEASTGGTYEVRTCHSGYGNNAWLPGAGFSNTGCPLRAYPGGGAVGYGTTSSLWFIRPWGTTFSWMRWNGWTDKRGGDCNWSTELKAHKLTTPSTSAWIGIGWTPGAGCNGYADTNDNPWGFSDLNIPSWAEIVTQEVVCGAGSCGGAYTPQIGSRWNSVYLIDNVEPWLTRFDGTVLSGRWMNDEETLSVAAEDNTGIQAISATMNGGQGVGSPVGYWCDWSKAIPCVSHSASIPFNTRTLTNALDGVYRLEVVVTDAAGNTHVRQPDIKIDNHAPSAVRLAQAGGDGWRRTNGFSVSWNTPREAYAPVTKVHYRVCRAGDPSSCPVQGEDGTGSMTELNDLRVPGEGSWELSVWREDEAGNGNAGDPSAASPPEPLRLDTTPPQVAFKPQDLDDPLRVSVSAGDNLAGVTAGEIELRRQGAKAWHPISTQVEGQELVAYVDDESFRNGDYVLRARAEDWAGNEASTDVRADGSRAGIRLPVRAATRLRAGRRKVVMRRRVVRRKGRRRVIRRRVERYISDLRARRGRRLRLFGRLTNPEGQPLEGATVYVYARRDLPTSQFSALGTVQTGRRGRFTFIAKASTSRVLRFRYPGGRGIGAATRDVRIGVPARSTFRVSDTTPAAGQEIILRGRVMSPLIPEEGKLVALQAHFNGLWRTFQLVRSDPRGRWAANYRFVVNRSARYPMRVRVPREAGFPFDSGGSRVVKVHVRTAR